MTVERHATGQGGELARLAPDQAPTRYTGGPDALIEAAHKARAAMEFAELVCYSNFVPEQYRRKPQEAAAAILAGDELGFSPMSALRAFDNIQGTATPKAITQRAVVQSLGHEIWKVESSAVRAVVRGRRKGSDKIEESVWTIERAAAFAKKNPNYNTQAEAMLIARAYAECSRLVASDALLGMPYSSEEIRDDDMLREPSPEQLAVGAVAPSRAARGKGRTTAAALTGAPAVDAAPAETPAAPVEDDKAKRARLWDEVKAAMTAAEIATRDEVAALSLRLLERPDGDFGQLSTPDLENLVDQLVDLGVDGIKAAASDRGAAPAEPDEPADPPVDEPPLEPSEPPEWPDTPAPGSGRRAGGGGR